MKVCVRSGFAIASAKTLSGVTNPALQRQRLGQLKPLYLKRSVLEPAAWSTGLHTDAHAGNEVRGLTATHAFHRSSNSAPTCLKSSPRPGLFQLGASDWFHDLPTSALHPPTLSVSPPCLWCHPLPFAAINQQPSSAS